MTKRRERNKPQQMPSSEQVVTPEQQMRQGKTGGHWKEHLGKYFIDLSKYVATGVVITSIFKDFEDQYWLYISGTVFIVLSLIVGLILTNNKEGE